MKKVILTAAVLCATGLSSVATADENNATNSMTTPDPASMQKMMENATPGEVHEALAKLAGKWTYVAKNRMMPEAPEQESKGISENKLIIGGRFLQQTIKGEFEMNGQAMPFEGLGLMGFDKQSGQYQAVWMDNMSTAMMISNEGSYDSETKTFTDSARFFCPMRGHEIDSKSKTVIVDDNTYTFSMYSPDENGEMFEGMTITYNRVTE